MVQVNTQTHQLSQQVADHQNEMQKSKIYVSELKQKVDQLLHKSNKPIILPCEFFEDIRASYE